jgi:hypothetical protein
VSEKLPFSKKLCAQTHIPPDKIRDGPVHKVQAAGLVHLTHYVGQAGQVKLPERLS